MRKLAALLLFLSALIARGGTVDVEYNFADFTDHPLNVSRVVITPIARDAYYSGAILSTRPIIYTKAAYPTLTNGTFEVTNLINGYAYRVEISDSFQTTTVTNYFGTNVTGEVNAASYLTPVLGLEQGVIVRAFSESGVTAEAFDNALTNRDSRTIRFNGGTQTLRNAAGVARLVMEREGHGTNAVSSSDNIEFDWGNDLNAEATVDSTGLRAFNVTSEGYVSASNLLAQIPHADRSNASVFVGYGGIQLPATWYGQEGSLQANTNWQASQIAWWQTGWDGTPKLPTDSPTVPQAMIQVRRNWGGGTVNPDNDRPTLHFASKGDIRIEPAYSHFSAPDPATYFGLQYLSLGNEDNGSRLYVNYFNGSVRTYPGSGTALERYTASTLKPWAKGYGLQLELLTVGVANSVEYHSRPSIWAFAGDTNATDKTMGTIKFNSRGGTYDIWQPTIDELQNPQDMALTVFEMKTNHVDFYLEGIKTDQIQASTNTRVMVKSPLLVTNVINHQVSFSTHDEMVVGAAIGSTVITGENFNYNVVGITAATGGKGAIWYYQDHEPSGQRNVNIGGNGGGRVAPTKITFSTTTGYSTLNNREMVTIDGGGLKQAVATRALTADNQTIGLTTNTVFHISSDNATAGNRTFNLTTGVEGREVTLMWNGTNAGELVDDAANAGSGNVRLNGTWTPTQYDVLKLIGIGNDWYEVSRSAN